MGTIASNAECSILSGSALLAKTKSNFIERKSNIFCSVTAQYKMIDFPDLSVSNFQEKIIGLKMVKGLLCPIIRQK